MKSIYELAQDLKEWAYGDGTVDLEELIEACEMASRHEVIVNCSTCNKQIRTYSKSQKFCSPECKQRYYYRPDYMRSYYLKQKKETFRKMIGEASE